MGIGANGSGFELDDIIVGLEAPPGRGGAAAGGKFWRRERDKYEIEGCFSSDFLQTLRSIVPIPQKKASIVHSRPPKHNPGPPRRCVGEETAG